MPFELFSQRKAKRTGKFPPKPTKIEFSARLRDAIFLTIRDCIGRYDESHNYISGSYAGNAYWGYLDRELFTQSDEYHTFKQVSGENASERVYKFLRYSTDAGVLDLLDVAAQLISTATDDLHRSADSYDQWRFGVTLSSSEALARLDQLLRVNGTIYRIAQGNVIISTEDFTHQEAVVPALQALAHPGFENALSEFHSALSHYRRGEFGDALTKANHAFESTMKVIATKMGWPFNESDTSAKLISVMLNNGLCPPMRESALTGLRTMLESDVPTLRNKTPSAGHGAGAKPATIPEPIATYAIVASAANVRLLIELLQIKAKR
jgi:hypothetical protein